MGLIALWFGIHVILWLGGSVAVMAALGNLHHAGLEIIPFVSHETTLGIMFPLFLWAFVTKSIELLTEMVSSG